MPLNIILFEPEIAPNTGNIIRLCANTGSHLHLIKPYGFSWDDKKLRRAGLDYAEWAHIKHWECFADFAAQLADVSRLFALTTKGTLEHHEIAFEENDSLLFGPETRGLPDDLLDTLAHAQKLRLPMVPGSRSLNLSNSVAVATYEAWRQLGFSGS
ncbi:MAG TPA: tRNA (uridine(34)/cytosine(34)/5-carboxymethylaminomethyluridine(34)-2'-O)-methyltransferase TrmL [Cellvibrionales bacterium]|jgi:tRNA (cytidine/uridine-2'-O-)-methyltransferase|nr:tRNA (uridine(34)/cytosine(34)/5-carboxymethylaminomethyluridine(34)-2'-O)-methyltransferase TrmL [Cellvibrionales bacterium]